MVWHLKRLAEAHPSKKLRSNCGPATELRQKRNEGFRPAVTLNHQLHMNSDPLDKLLDAYSRQPAPKPPDRFAAGVWQEIKLRRDQSLWRRALRSLGWQELFREPRVAIPALALAVLIGLLPALSIRSYDRTRLARESLHFEVFSPKLSVTTLWTDNLRAPKSP